MVRSKYLNHRYCSWCGEWVGRDDCRCPCCHKQTRGGNGRSHTYIRRKCHVSGLTGKEALVA